MLADFLTQCFWGAGRMRIGESSQNDLIWGGWTKPTMTVIETHDSIDWFKGKITGKSHISLENLWFPVKIFPEVNPLNDDQIYDRAATAQPLLP